MDMNEARAITAIKVQDDATRIYNELKAAAFGTNSEQGDQLKAGPERDAILSALHAVAEQTAQLRQIEAHLFLRLGISI